MQAYGADVMLAEMFTPCSALLAHKLDLPWINHWPIAPVEVLLLDCECLVHHVAISLHACMFLLALRNIRIQPILCERPLCH